MLRQQPCLRFHFKMKILSFLSSIFLLFCFGQVFAFNIPSHPDNYVNDYANLLSTQAKVRLNQRLGDFEKQTSNQLVVVTIPDLGNEPIEDYSIHLADRWKIGTHQHDNGIILLLSKAEHKIRIEVGYGLEGVLPDALAEQIIQNEISPALHQGNFDAGVEHGVDAIILATQNEYRATASTTQESNSTWMKILGFIIVLLIILRVLGLLRATLLYCLGLSTHIHTPFWDTFSSGGFSGGGRGGFSGGGGGGFGGGGASGGW